MRRATNISYNSFDKHNQRRWNIYGVYLPDDALQKIHSGNILRVTPRLRRLLGDNRTTIRTME